METSNPTTDQQKIRAWAAVHGAIPVEVSSTLFDSEPTKLGFVFLKGGSAKQPEFKPIEWDHFFALFDLMQLSVVLDPASPGSYEILQMDGREQIGFAVGPS